MSPLTFPLNRKARGAAPGQSIIASVARLLPILTMAAFTLAVLPNSGCGKGFFPRVTSSATATTVPTVGPSSTATAHALGREFSMRGNGSQANPTFGTCSGQKCGAPKGDCLCVQFMGSLLSSVVGNSNWTASLTINNDDCTSTGTSGGFCCTGDGLFNATNGKGKSASVLALSFTGPICVDPNSSPNPLVFDSSLEATFEVLTSSSSGKFLNSTGNGHINIFTDTNSGTAYLAALGEIQVGAR